MVVFEGPAHPYKDNLVKVDGRTRRADTPGIVAEIAKAKVLQQAA